MTFETYETGTNWETDADFSQVAKVPAAQATVYTSGQVAYDDDANIVGVGDIEAQTRKAFENLKRSLSAADASLSDVVKIRYSVTDRSHYETIVDLRPEYLSEPYPTGMLAVVDGLAEADLLVELEAIAAVSD